MDERTRPLTQELVADEIYVKKPVFMVVEPESLCWLTGTLTESASGEGWADWRRTGIGFGRMGI